MASLGLSRRAGYPRILFRYHPRFDAGNTGAGVEFLLQLCCETLGECSSFTKGKTFRRAGGLATAKRMLKPRSSGQRAGLDVLLGAGRPDLTMEAVLLRPQFRSLFSKEELRVAAERLGQYGKEVAIRTAMRERLFPDELEAGPKYSEGARKQVRVNAYELNPRARTACLKRHGYRCSVCELLFEERYGEIGKHFIHVHHGYSDSPAAARTFDGHRNHALYAHKSRRQAERHAKTRKF
jgi:hypothetical protein